jgi:hypothetical protein
MLYVYALTRSTIDAPPDEVGLDGRPLDVVRYEHVAAVISAHDAGARPRPTAQNVLRHERVVESTMSRGPVLPARFGTMYATRDKLEEALRRGHDALRLGLDRVEGCVELGVRVLSSDKPAEPAPVHSGREYMLAKLAGERARAAARRRAEEAVAPLADLAAGVVVRDPRPSAPALLTVAYLVVHDRVDTFKQAVQRLAPAHPAIRLLCTGPWPPYHFVPVLDAPEADRHA